MAILQKVEALAGRSEPQTRDPFDLYLLVTTEAHDKSKVKSATRKKLKAASEKLTQLNYQDYKGQVVEYLEPDYQAQYGGKEYWNLIQEKVLDWLSDE